MRDFSKEIIVLHSRCRLLQDQWFCLGLLPLRSLKLVGLSLEPLMLLHAHRGVGVLIKLVLELATQLCESTKVVGTYMDILLVLGLRFGRLGNQLLRHTEHRLRKILLLESVQFSLVGLPLFDDFE